MEKFIPVGTNDENVTGFAIVRLPDGFGNGRLFFHASFDGFHAREGVQVDVVRNGLKLYVTFDHINYSAAKIEFAAKWYDLTPLGMLEVIKNQIDAAGAPDIVTDTFKIAFHARYGNGE